MLERIPNWIKELKALKELGGKSVMTQGRLMAFVLRNILKRNGTEYSETNGESQLGMAGTGCAGLPWRAQDVLDCQE